MQARPIQPWGQEEQLTRKPRDCTMKRPCAAAGLLSLPAPDTVAGVPGGVAVATVRRAASEPSPVSSITRQS